MLKDGATDEETIERDTSKPKIVQNKKRKAKNDPKKFPNSKTLLYTL